jgi:hypothetical protein
MNLVEETREEFKNLYIPRVENPNGRERTSTARGAEGARAWGELFIPDTPDEQIQLDNLLLEEIFTPQSNTVVRSSAVVQNKEGTQNNRATQGNAGAQNNASAQ